MIARNANDRNKRLETENAEWLQDGGLMFLSILTSYLHKHLSVLSQ